MVIDAPRKQWLIDFRAWLDANYSGDFIIEKDREIRNWVRAYAWGEFERTAQYEMWNPMEALQMEIAEMFDEWCFDREAVVGD